MNTIDKTEKITINVGAVDLGQIDLLVENGFYSNRTDFVKTAIRNQISSHQAHIDQMIASKVFAVGVVKYDKEEIEMLLQSGRFLEIQLIGMLIIDKDVTPELIAQAFKKVKLYGIIKASPAVKEAIEKIRS